MKHRADTRPDQASPTRRSKRLGRRLLAAALLATLFGIAWGPAAAADPTASPSPTPEELPPDQTATWAIGPVPAPDQTTRSRFALEVDRGQVLTDKIRIANLGVTELVLNVYAADGVTTANGEFTVRPGTDPVRDVGSWVAPEVNQVTVPAGKQVEIPFTITVPEDAVPGDHAGGIVASRITTQQDEEGVEVAVDQRVGVRLYLRVKGEAKPGLEIENLALDYDAPFFPFGNRPAKVTFDVVNTGNLTLGVHSVARLAGPFSVNLGREVTRELELILPGDRVSVVFEIPGALPLGPIRASVDVAGINLIDFPEIPMPSDQESVSRFALAWLIVILLALLIGWRVWVVVRRRRKIKRLEQLAKRAEGGAVAPTTEPADSDPELDAESESDEDVEDFDEGEPEDEADAEPADEPETEPAEEPGAEPGDEPEAAADLADDPADEPEQADDLSDEPETSDDAAEPESGEPESDSESKAPNGQDEPAE